MAIVASDKQHTWPLPPSVQSAAEWQTHLIIMPPPSDVPELEPPLDPELPPELELTAESSPPSAVVLDDDELHAVASAVALKSVKRA